MDDPEFPRDKKVQSDDRNSTSNNKNIQEDKIAHPNKTPAENVKRVDPGTVEMKTQSSESIVSKHEGKASLKTSSPSSHHTTVSSTQKQASVTKDNNKQQTGSKVQNSKVKNFMRNSEASNDNQVNAASEEDTLLRLEKAAESMVATVTDEDVSFLNHSKTQLFLLNSG